MVDTRRMRGLLVLLCLITFAAAVAVGSLRPWLYRVGFLLSLVAAGFCAAYGISIGLENYRSG